MDTTDAVRWVEEYVKAWESNDPEVIGALFTSDARYLTAPWRRPWSGREAIVREWLDRRDEPGQWSFTFEPVAVAGDLAIVQGVTTYQDQPPVVYSNLWLIRLDDQGRCTEFTEWWMLQGKAVADG
jgi:ketosteroid isomerase-like protein